MRAKRVALAMMLAFGIAVTQVGCGGGSGAPSAGPGAGPSGTGGTTADVASSGTGGAATTIVAPASTGIAKLSWNLNESRAVGFKVYYGTSSGSYTSTVDAGMTPTFSVTGLAPGTYYFAVTAYDANGNESGYSDEVSKTIS